MAAVSSFFFLLSIRLSFHSASCLEAVDRLVFLPFRSVDGRRCQFGIGHGVEVHHLVYGQAAVRVAQYQFFRVLPEFATSLHSFDFKCPNCTLSGISTARYLASRERTGTASATASFAKKADNVWTAGLYVFGFSPAAENILAVEVLMKEEDSVFNERQSVDLTPYLRGFDGDEISLELDLHIGRELEIGGPVIIPDWEDTPETEFP